MLVRVLPLSAIALSLLRLACADPCSDLAQDIADTIGTPSAGYVPADSAIACLKAIPFHQATALDTIQNVRKYLAFYSAATYVEQQPTPELELPPININKTIDDIEDKVRRAKYKSNFDFDRDVHNLFGSVKDGHLTFSPTCYARVFKWEHDYPLVQVASAPDKIPEIYTADVVSMAFGPVNVKEKVSKINGLPPEEFLEEMAKIDPESDWVDPDARYNELLAYMRSGFWVKGNFAERYAYYEDPITIEFASGKKVTVEWRAKYLGAGVMLSRGWGDVNSFYQLLCLRTKAEIEAATGHREEKYQPVPTLWERPTNTRSPATRTAQPTLDLTFLVGEDDVVETPTPTAKSAKPTIPASVPQIRRRQTPAENNIYPSGAVYIRTTGQELGYYILDSQTAVLMVAAFISIDDSISDEDFQMKFSTFITEAIADAKKRGITRFLIDLSGNGGGSMYLGQDMARQFFPTSDKIFFGQNMRWNPVLSTVLLEGDQQAINDTFFDIGHYLKPDGSDFSSMGEMLGPVYRDGDYFTEISIPDEIEANRDSFSTLKQDYSGPDPFKSDNVILITSGMCGSTCAILAEAFTAAGARTVAFGGRPRVGPMQGVGGIKGSQVLEFDDIMYFIALFLPNSWTRIPGVPTPMKLRLASASVNFRNSWRRVGQYLPIEWLYVPADWKLFYTPQMLQELQMVHEAARDVAWNGGKDMSGGKYIPINGVDGSGWKPGSGAVGSRGSGARSGTGWLSLGQLIWWKMGRGEK